MSAVPDDVFARSPDERRAALAALVAQERDGRRVYPLSYSQLRLWLLDQLAPGSAYYNVSLGVPIPARVNATAMQAALNELVRRHETLRTTFAEEDGEPVQVVAPTLTIGLELVDLTTLGVAEREQGVRDVLLQTAQEPFDLRSGPLLRATLVRRRDDDHLLALALHHIVTDGWSMGVFLRELTDVYGAYAAGRRSPLPPLALQYGDYAIWQREWLRDDVLEHQLAYWRRQLVDLPMLNLPTDRPRPRVQSHRGATRPFVVEAALARGLREVGAAAGVTTFMTTLAAFAVLLSRYAGQDDIPIGTYIANRNRTEVEGLIGFFVNTLVLRADCSGDPAFTDLLRRIRTTAVDAYAHQDVPFEMLADELQPERDLSRNPLFQVVFQLPMVPGMETDSSGSLPPAESQAGTAAFDLAVTVWEAGPRLIGQVEYSTDLFDDATIARMIDSYQSLLAGIVADPARRLSELPLLSDSERRRVVTDYNATTFAYDERSLVERFELQVDRTPDATAFSSGTERLSYAELDARANRLAHRLQALGAGPEVLVGVHLQRSLAAPVAVLAVLKAGAAWLPLDRSYPAARLRHMLADSGTRILLTAAGAGDGLDDAGLQVVEVDGDALDAGESTRLGVRARPSDLAYAIYTSGSTGLPKGVAVEHRQVLNRLAWMWAAYPWRPGEVNAQRTPLSFVDSIWELFGALLCGVPTVILDDDVARDPVALVAALGEQRVTRLWVVPSLLRALLDVPGIASRLPDLRFWVTSGEAIGLELYRRFCAQMPHAALYNLYGTSEVWDATWWDPVGAPQPEWHVPIGCPIANTRALVLDRHGQPVPIGVPGELHIGGDGVARGYIDRPELTAEKFVADPLSGERLYRTGDVARWTRDGNLELLERVDRQLKLRGFRIEPGEIESALRGHPEVDDCAVVTRPRADGEPALVAYVAHGDRPAPEPAELRRGLAERLPAHMVPSTFVAVRSLPLSPNGKIDRAALPDPDERPGGGGTTPRTDLELVLAQLWSGVLERDGIRLETDFFAELGGHSLLGTKLVARVRTTLGVEFPLRELFEQPTIEGMARLLLARPDRDRIERTAALVRHVQELSDDEVEAMLASRGADGGPGP